MVVRRLAAALSLALAGVVLPVAASYAADASDLYVASGGDDANECTQAAPCASVQRAIDLAASSGTTVHVGAGTFSGEVEPGAKSVDLEGVSAADTTLTTPQDSGDGYVMLVTTGTTTLSSLTIEGGLFVDVFVLGGTVEADHVFLDHGGCGLVVTAGQANLTDSTVQDGGMGCIIGPEPGDFATGLVVVTGGGVSLVRDQLLDPTPDDPAVSVTDGTLSVDQTFFDDAANDPETSNSPGVQLAGGTATVSRSTIHAFGTGVLTQGGTVSLSDSTLQHNVVGLASSAGSATVVRSTFQGELASLQQQGTGTISVVGSVLGADDIDDCNGSVIDLGYNLATDDSCDLTAGTSHNEVADLNLDTGLADRGGPTFLPTVAILWPSSAVDTIPVWATYGDDHTPLCPHTSTDLRGVPRPVGGACDAGSMEMAQTVTTIDAAAKVKPGSLLELDVEVSVPLIDLGLDVPNGTVTVRGGGEVVCRDLTVDHFAASCDVPDVTAGRHRYTAEFTPANGNTIHPSTSARATVLVGTEPVVKGPDKVAFKVGERVSIKVRASGAPTPYLSMVGGHLPRGLTFHRGHGKATITGRAEPGSAGRHQIRVRATNLVGQDGHRLTLVVKRR